MSHTSLEAFLQRAGERPTAVHEPQAAEAAAGQVRESSFSAFLAAGGASIVSSLDLDILSFTVRQRCSDAAAASVKDRTFPLLDTDSLTN